MTTTETVLRIGTRKSPLALWQAEHVAAALSAAHPGLRVELVGIETRGDKILDVALAQVGGKGLFVKELEAALLDGRVDLCVHSTKDMPGELPPGLGLVAFPPRADPRDALVAGGAGGVAALPPKARVGTSSLRRQAQLLAVRPDLEIVSVRGNVATRIAKVAELGLSCVVLAAAGLDRLGLGERIAHRFGPEEMLPAAGQGILAVEARLDDDRVLAMLRVLDDKAARRAVLAERAFLSTLGGGCQVPIAAYATEDGGVLTLRGLVARPDGSALVRAVRQGDPGEPERLGRALGEEVLVCGGRRVLVDIGLDIGLDAELDTRVAARSSSLEGTVAVVVRDEAPADRISLALLAAGAHVVPLRLMRIAAPRDPAPLERALRELASFDVVAFTSRNAVEHTFHRLAEAGLDLRALRDDALIASVGKATSAALSAHGVHVDIEGHEGAAALASAIHAALPLAARRVLLPRAEDGREELVDAIAARRGTCVVVDAYRSEPVPDPSIDAALDALRAPGTARRVVILTSPRRAELFGRALGGQAAVRLADVHMLALGESTAEAVRAQGLPLTRVVAHPTPESVVAATRELA